MTILDLPDYFVLDVGQEYTVSWNKVNRETREVTVVEEKVDLTAVDQILKLYDFKTMEGSRVLCTKKPTDFENLRAIHNNSDTCS